MQAAYAMTEEILKGNIIAGDIDVNQANEQDAVVLTRSSQLGTFMGVGLSVDTNATEPELKSVFPASLHSCLPRPINFRNAVKRTMSSMHFNDYFLAGNKKIEFIIEGVITGAEETLVWELWRRIVDKDNVQLSFEPSMQFKIASDGILQQSPMRQDLLPQEDDAAKAVEEAYRKNCGVYSSSNIRDILNRAIFRLASGVRWGHMASCVFIPKAHDQVITDLTMAIENLKNGANGRKLTDRPESCYLETIPIFSAQSAKIKNYLELQVEQEAEELYNKIVEAMTTGKFNKKTVDAASDQLNQLEKLTSEYQKLLDFKEFRSASNLERAFFALNDLKDEQDKRRNKTKAIDDPNQCSLLDI